jgi:pimeloyl-ACP methyl ester carboxylesterase
MPSEPGNLAPEEVTIRSGDTAISALRCGEGPPIVLLHGWTLNRRSLQAQIDGLSRSMTVLAPDRRGCGLSTGTPDLDAELADLDRMVAALDAGPVHLLGVSQGGRVALRYAAKCPHKLRSLVLQGAVLDGFQPSETAGEDVPLERYRNWVRNGQIEAMRHDWLQHPMLTRGLNDPAQREALERIVAGYRGEDLLQSAAAQRPHDTASRLEELRLPTLIITGSLEIASRRAHAARILDLLPDAAEVLIEGAGHLSNFTHPVEYNALVLEFCQAVDRRR